LSLPLFLPLLQYLLAVHVDLAADKVLPAAGTVIDGGVKPPPFLCHHLFLLLQAPVSIRVKVAVDGPEPMAGGTVVKMFYSILKPIILYE